MIRRRHEQNPPLNSGAICDSIAILTRQQSLLLGRGCRVTLPCETSAEETNTYRDGRKGNLGYHNRSRASCSGHANTTKREHERHRQTAKHKEELSTNIRNRVAHPIPQFPLCVVFCRRKEQSSNSVVGAYHARAVQQPDRPERSSTHSWAAPLTSGKGQLYHALRANCECGQPLSCVAL